jgi:hypothetical protein
MADDIRLVIGVEQSGLLKAITNTESLEGKVKKLSAAYARDAASYGRYNKAIGDLAKATGKNKKELLSYGRALRADEKATKKASAEVKAFTLARKEATRINKKLTDEKTRAVKATQDLARSQEKEAASLRSLRMATDSVYRNQQKRLQMKKLLKSAIAAETMTTEQAIVALKRYNAAQVSSNKVMGMAKSRMNGNNMAIQQLGYQFGDFAVQVQGGTSAFVAFSQQGAQLAGILPMVAGPLGLSMGAAVGLSAALGILIPIGSAVARMFFEMNGAAEKAEDALGNTVTAINDYRRSVEFSKKTTQELNAEFGEASKQLTKMQGLLQSVAVSRALDGLTTGSSMFGEDLDDAVSHIKDIQAAMDNVKVPTAEQTSIIGEEAGLVAREAIEGFKDQMIDAADALGLLPKQAIELQTALKNINKSKDMEGMRDSSLAALEVIKSLGFEFGKIPIPIAEVIENLENVAGSASRATHAIDKITDAEQELLDLTLKISQSTPYGPMTLLQIEAAKAQAEMVKLVEASAELKDEIGDAAFEAIRLADVDIASGVSTAAKEAAKLAANLNISLLAAMNLKNLQGSIESGGGRGAGTEYKGQQDYTSEMGYESIQSQIDKFNKKEAKANKPTKDPIAEFQKKLDLERELLGVSESRQKVLQALGSDVVAKNPEIAAGMEAQINATNELITLEERRQGLIDSITGSIENGMMAMIDGTVSVKDAFKSMAAEIIKELYRVLVVQQMVNAAKTAFGLPFADGGAFSGGSQIQAYADGGVVGSPTTFPMSGGKTGLMGEAGPEAIMPLKRGSNGKLGVQMEGGGGGDNIVINQSFNFQANGDDSVKKLIAQAAPKIADMAKASVIESRRRGGSTKAAFG